jgi:hypothetical protein
VGAIPATEASGISTLQDVTIADMNTTTAIIIFNVFSFFMSFSFVD